jgi:hypothetical protein
VYEISRGGQESSVLEEDVEGIRSFVSEFDRVARPITIELDDKEVIDLSV